MNEPLYAYTIVAAAAAVPHGLCQLAFGELALIVSPLGNTPVWQSLGAKGFANPAHVERHLQVQLQLLGQPQVPLAYGTVLKDEAAAKQFLAHQYDKLLHKLRTQGHYVEYTLKVSLPEPEKVNGGGKEHFMAKYKLHLKQQEETGIRAQLSAHIQQQLPVLQVFNEAQTLQVALPQHLSEAFIALLRAWKPSHITLSCTGPWPPHTLQHDTRAEQQRNGRVA